MPWGPPGCWGEQPERAETEAVTSGQCRGWGQLAGLWRGKGRGAANPRRGWDAKTQLVLVGDVLGSLCQGPGSALGGFPVADREGFGG